MGDSNFQFFAELPVIPQADGVVGTLNCCDTLHVCYVFNVIDRLF